jgi:hypothetical protein
VKEAFLDIIPVTTVLQMLVMVAECEGTAIFRLALAFIFFQSL